MITFDELTKLTEKDLEEELNKSKLDLLKIRLAVSARQSKETSKLKILRRYIARIQTIKRKRAMELEMVPAKPKTSVTK